MGLDILYEELVSRSVFRDRGILSLEYVPPSLPHRENEYRLLAQIFRPVLDSPGYVAPRVLIKGAVGVGKTALSKRFGYDLELTGKKQNIKLFYEYVNCRECGSLFNVLKVILRRFEPALPPRGLSADELLELLIDVLNKQNAYLLATLDELEYLINREGSEPFYKLSRIQEQRSGQYRLSLIFILREPTCDLLIRELDKSAVSTALQHIIALKPYRAHELVDILKQRAVKAFKPGCITDECLELIADIAEDAGGDARYAIELLERAGIYADAERSPIVLPTHVRRAHVDLVPQIRREYLRPTSLHEKLILLALVRIMEEGKTSYVTMGELRSSYRVVCEEYNLKPLGYTQFWKYVKRLITTGVVSLRSSHEGYRGNTTLIGLLVPATPLREEVEKLLSCDLSL